MVSFKVFEDEIYYDEGSAAFSFTSTFPDNYAILPDVDELLRLSPKPTSYAFCLNIIDSCNLSCDYCFNVIKSGKSISDKSAIVSLERLFSLFPDGEKYFVDLSGKGEPLLALKQVLEIANWCHKKQDAIRKEILVQFVCNGTLLRPEIADLLQRKGILFGVSLDGDEFTHDAHRKDKNGNPTFKSILRNVTAIKHRDYVGCAGTITNDVFPLLETINALLPIFRTISFRPVRGDMRIGKESVLRWIKEYERLAKSMHKDGLAGDDRVFLALMNGDDYFGRFLCRAFGGQVVLNRCDGGVSRFSVDLDGSIYRCPAATKEDKRILDDLRYAASDEFTKQARACAKCTFKYLCGGECPVELERLGEPWNPMCELTKRMIVIANWLELRIALDRPSMHERLSRFVEEKSARSRKDPVLELFLAHHSHLSFTEGKRLFDQKHKRY